MDKMVLRNLASDLKIPINTLEADIKSLAHDLEFIVSEMPTPAPVGATLVSFATISSSYLRGRNVRMGNLASLGKHRNKQYDLLCLILQCISEYSYLFRRLREEGITPEGTFTDRLGERGASVLLEADQILRNRHGNQKEDRGE